jgi:hypothetical protein
MRRRLMPLHHALHPAEAAARPFAGTSDGRSTADDWRPLFASYSAIVLVANSDSVDIDALRASLPEDALFVFFNRVFKVLDRPFDGNALLVARSGSGGANIVRRREVANVVGYFPSDRFLGIMSVKASSHEKVATTSDFGGVPTGQLDLAGYFADFYPPDHLPSTGFALAVWLCELDLGQQIVLAGFSGKRSYRWKMFDAHDWTFEQVVQRVLVRCGPLTVASAAAPHAYAALTKRFPDISPADISLAAAEILSERLENANKEIDRLISVTKVNRSMQKFIRSLQPVENFIRRLKRRPASES